MLLGCMFKQLYTLILLDRYNRVIMSALDSELIPRLDDKKVNVDLKMLLRNVKDMA